MTNRAKGNAALLITAMIWGSGFIAQKLGMDYIDPFTFNGIRQIIACMILLPLSVHVARDANCFSREEHGAQVVAQRRRSLLKASLICGVLMALGSNLQQIGLSMISAGKSGFITTIYIVLVPIFAICFGTRARAKVWLSVLLAMGGFGLLSLKDGFGSVGTGDLLTLLSAVCFALQIIAVDRHVTKDNAVLLSTVQMAVSGGLSIVCMFLFEHPELDMLRQSALPLLYSALVPTAIGFTLQIVGQKYTDPTIASLLLSLEAVFSALFGVILLGERMSPREWLGCAIIFAATILSQLPEKDRTTTS